LFCRKFFLAQVADPLEDRRVETDCGGCMSWADVCWCSIG
jgi:hypothetical protein